MTRRRSTLSQGRHASYKTSQAFGLANAISRGRLPQWLFNHYLGRGINRATRKIWR